MVNVRRKGFGIAKTKKTKYALGTHGVIMRTRILRTGTYSYSREIRNVKRTMLRDGPETTEEKS